MRNGLGPQPAKQQILENLCLTITREMNSAGTQFTNDVDVLRQIFVV